MSLNDKQLEEIFRIRMEVLDDESEGSNPVNLLSHWLDEARFSGCVEHNSMVLSTVDSLGHPSSRVVLLKEIVAEGLYFFTNYSSRKAHELSVNPRVAVNFHWPNLERQIRVEGLAVKGDTIVSDEYFQSRSRGSQIGAWASPQSKMIPDRAFLEKRFKEFESMLENQELNRPDYWGAYLIQPSRMEFWKGRENRLHDRIEYYLVAGKWKNRRLAP